MSVPQIKGYCPGALRPMQSGDGLVVRVRPFNGRIEQAQAIGIAAMATAHGNGIIDLSSRGNLQIRGVTDESYSPLLDGLRSLDLIDPSAEIESRRNLLVTPFWDKGEETQILSAALTDALSGNDAPAIPGKFGFAVDTGPMPVLQTASADIRLERDEAGGLILCADGADRGKPVTSKTIIDEAIALAHWFLQARTTQNRMAALLKGGVALPPDFRIARQKQTYLPTPNDTPQGTLVGLAFGQMRAATLDDLAKHGALRMTPWRMLLVEGAGELPNIEGVIHNPDDPHLRIHACTGAPDCAQGFAPTRSIARRLAPYLKPHRSLHISGCAKGCAHPKSAPLTITATQSGFDLIRNGKASDTPARTALTPDDIIKAL